MQSVGRSFCAAGLLRVLEFSVVLTSAFAVDLRQAELSSLDVPADAAPRCFINSSDDDNWIVASTGIGTLPFIRARRLGPVPFE
jgi:hypothetical protein